MNIQNSIAANSSGRDCKLPQATTVINSIIEDGSCNTSALSVDPKLGPLADNGGPTKTHALYIGSPAIDAGDDTICANSPINNLDQRGEARPVGVHCDIGAYEGAIKEQTSFFIIPERQNRHLWFINIGIVSGCQLFLKPNSANKTALFHASLPFIATFT